MRTHQLSSDFSCHFCQVRFIGEMELLSAFVRYARLAPRQKTPLSHSFLRRSTTSLNYLETNCNSESRFLATLSAPPYSCVAFNPGRYCSTPCIPEYLAVKRRIPWILARPYSFSGAPKDERKKPTDLTEKRYHEIADETLESLTVAFEELVDTGKCHPDFDVMCSSGVLTLRLTPCSTYVINKQTPNRQMWLSSPMSGPKRYDFVDNTWIYLHDASNMHRLLTEEISRTLDVPVDFSRCAYGQSSR